MLENPDQTHRWNSDSVRGGQTRAVFPHRTDGGAASDFPAEVREAAPMTTDMRKSGIDVVGDMPWGTHFCLFYETKEDLLDTLVPYCKAGLEGQEFCLWVVADPMMESEASHALKCAIPDFDQYLASQSIEIVSARDWYLQGGRFELARVIERWHAELARASARGYAGV